MDEQDIQERIHLDFVGGGILFHQVHFQAILSKHLLKALNL